jgi:hypothetical protein
MKYLLNVDCLEFKGSSSINLNQNLSNDIYYFSNGLFVKLQNKNQNIYHPTYNYFKIFYEQNEIGDLYTKSLDLSLINGHNFKIKINNEIFYGQDLGLMLKMIHEALLIDETKIIRLDICYDTNEDVLTKFKTLFNNVALQFKNEAKLYINGTGDKDKTLYIGSMQGREKCIAIYDKTKEINHSHKEYIRNLHRKTIGFYNIYRVELRLLNKLPEIANIDLMSLGSNEYLESIYNSYLDNLIYFTDKVTKERIEFITLNNTGIKIKKIIKKRSVGSTKKMKEVINILEREHKTSTKTEERKAIKLVINKLIKDKELEVWYNNKK